MYQQYPYNSEMKTYIDILLNHGSNDKSNIRKIGSNEKSENNRNHVSI